MVVSRVIAASSRAIILAVAVLLLDIQSAYAQGLPFCPGRWVNPGGGIGMMCQCPDGSFTNLGQAGCPTGPRVGAPSVPRQGRGSAIPGLVGGVLGILGTLGDSQSPESACPPAHAFCGQEGDQSRCCYPGNICSKFGCVPEGSVDCGDYACSPGRQCSSGGGCVPQGHADCGNGRSCDPGFYCSRIADKCVPQGNVDCGEYSCEPGNRCGTNRQCIREASTEPPRLRSTPQPHRDITSPVKPSFDCNEARNPLAQTICKHPRLARADIRYVQAYQAVKHQRVQQGRGDKDSKREAVDFIESVVTQCGIPAIFNPDETTPESMINCIASTYQAQRDRLQSQLNAEAVEESTRPIDEHLELQQMLAQRFPDIMSPDGKYKNDGVYGPATRSAITEFQRTQGRQATGFLGDADARTLKLSGR